MPRANCLTRRGSYVTCCLAALCLLSAMVSSDDLQAFYTTTDLGWLHVRSGTVRLSLPIQSDDKLWCTSARSCDDCAANTIPEQQFTLNTTSGRKETREIHIQSGQRPVLCLTPDETGQKDWRSAREVALPSTLAIKAVVVATYYVALCLVHGTTGFSAKLLALAAAFGHFVNLVDEFTDVGALPFVLAVTAPLVLAWLHRQQPALASLGFLALFALSVLLSPFVQALQVAYLAILTHTVNGATWAAEFLTLPAVVYLVGSRLEGKSQLAPYAPFLAATLFGVHVARQEISATFPVLLPVLALLVVEYVLRLGEADEVEVTAAAAAASAASADDDFQPEPEQQQQQQQRADRNAFTGTGNANGQTVATDNNSAFRRVSSGNRASAVKEEGADAQRSVVHRPVVVHAAAVPNAVEFAIAESGGYVSVSAESGGEADDEITRAEDPQRPNKRPRSPAGDDGDDEVPSAKVQAQ